MSWHPPNITLRWGPYFRQDPEEQAQVIALVQEALGKGGTGEVLITKRIAVERIAPIFGIENIEAALEALEGERAERDERELAKSTGEAKALHEALGDGGTQPDGDRGTGGGQPPKAAGGRGRIPGAPVKEPK